MRARLLMSTFRRRFLWLVCLSVAASAIWGSSIILRQPQRHVFIEDAIFRPAEERRWDRWYWYGWEGPPPRVTPCATDPQTYRHMARRAPAVADLVLVRRLARMNVWLAMAELVIVAAGAFFTPTFFKAIIDLNERLGTALFPYSVWAPW